MMVMFLMVLFLQVQETEWYIIVEVSLIIALTEQDQVLEQHK